MFFIYDGSMLFFWQIFLPSGISPLPGTPAPEDLFYTLPRFNITLHFKPVGS